MLTIALTVEQARYFKEYGRLLLIDKAEDAPGPYAEITGTPLYRGITIGAEARFAEPWEYNKVDYRVLYAADHPDLPWAWQRAELMADKDVRLFGRCVDCSVRILDSLTEEEARDTGVDKGIIETPCPGRTCGVFRSLESYRSGFMGPRMNELKWTDLCTFTLFEACDKNLIVEPK